MILIVNHPPFYDPFELMLIDLLNESMGKFNEFASAAKSTLAAQEWGTWSKQSRPIASFTCLGLSVVTLFLFGHF